MAPPSGQVQQQQRPRGQQPQQQQGFGQMLVGIVRMAVFWYFAMKFFSPKKPSDPSQLISNAFQKGEPLVSSPISLSRAMLCDFSVFVRMIELLRRLRPLKATIP
ncbi:hypothetical protein ACLOJK_016903 [Asimina triloba]